MSKKFKVVLTVVAVIMSLFAVLAFTTTAEEKEITISYMDAHEPSSGTTSRDSKAYANGNQTVKAGEEFTLPTTANLSYVGEEGYQLVWYTSEGRSYKGGEKVSFTEDTKLFRAVLKEVYSVDEASAALASGSHGALLMCDINAGNAYLNVWGENYAILDLNGFTISFEKNGSIMGGQRSGKVVIGEGTFKVTNPDGKIGNYYVFECKGHSYNGDRNKVIIGKDVTIDAPNFFLAHDSDGSATTGYPWIRIYGTVNVHHILTRGGSTVGNPKIEFFEGCNVTINGPYLTVDRSKPTDTTIYNHQSFEIRIYGGTFNLPAEAANESFWTVDNIANQSALTNENKDLIKIEGGTFILPGNAVPAISEYLTADSVALMSNLYDFIKNNRANAEYEVTYQGIRNAYKIKLTNTGTLTVTDNMGTGLAGTYYYTATKNSGSTDFETIQIFDDADKTIPTTKFKYGLIGNTMLFGTPQMQTDYKLQALTANGVTYQVVVTAQCGNNASHSFNSEADATVEATCQHTAYANYVCSGCGYSAYFNWGETADHAFALANDKKATATTLGEKVFACSECSLSKTYPYTVDPTSLEITVVIRNDDGTFETKTVLASEIFDFAISGVEGAQIYTVSAVKPFGSYKVRNIYGITIPAGIMYVKITSQNYEKYQNVEYGVTEIIVADGANVSFLNIGNLRRVKTIKVGAANVTFGRECSYYTPSNEKRAMSIIETIDLSTPGATVYFDEYAFSGRTTIKNLLLADNSSYTFCYQAFNNGAINNLDLSKNSTYDIKSEAFNGNDFLELIIPDNATNITMAGSPFKSCLTTYMYIGKNFVINSAIGYDMKYLEKVVIMDGVTFGSYIENLFYNAGSADFTTPFYVYNHSTAFLSNGNLPKQTFNNCDGIFFYTVTNGIGTRTDVFNNCADVKDADGNLLYKAWTIYLGIPHSYDNIIDPTCTEKGELDCPCGVYSWNVHDGKWGYATFAEDSDNPGCGTVTVAYKKYQSVHNIKDSTAVAEDTTLEGAQKTYVILPALGHDLKSVITEPLCLVEGEENLVCQREGCDCVQFVRVIDPKGHEMIYTLAYADGFDKAGVRVDKCRDCDDVTTESEAKAIFVALGYSIGPDGKALKAGFSINLDELGAYKAINPDFVFGMVMVNANSVATSETLFVDGELNTTAKGLKIEAESIKYVTWNADIAGFNAEIASSLELVIGLYAIDAEGNVTIMQYVDADKYETTKTYGDMSVNAITFNQVRVGHGLEALVPQATPAPNPGDDE